MLTYSHIHTGQFLYNNYKQALDLIKTYTAELATFKVFTNFADKDFKAWNQEELAYLKDCASEPAATSVAISYIAELEKLQFAE